MWPLDFAIVAVAAIRNRKDNPRQEAIRRDEIYAEQMENYRREVIRLTAIARRRKADGLAAVRITAPPRPRR